MRPCTYSGPFRPVNMMRWLMAFAAGIALLAQVAMAHPLHTTIESRIYGGVEIINRIPWMTSLLKRNSHHCGGTLIAARWVLTAAHCVIDKQGALLAPSLLSVLVGGLELKQLDQFQSAGVLQVMVAPNWDKAQVKNDLALVYLDRPVQAAAYAVLNGMSTRAQEADGSSAMVFGWGSTETSGDAMSPVLRGAAVPLVDLARCQQTYGASLITANNICAGAAGKDACTGDSGGPLLAEYASGIAQVGITSWGAGCGVAGEFGVYTRVAPYLPWITQMMKTAGSSG